MGFGALQSSELRVMSPFPILEESPASSYPKASITSASMQVRLAKDTRRPPGDRL